MSKVSELERQVQNLSTDELAHFRRWFADFDAEIWDQEIQSDAKAGKLDALIEEGLAEHRSGKTRPL